MKMPPTQAAAAGSRFPAKSYLTLIADFSVQYTEHKPCALASRATQFWQLLREKTFIDSLRQPRGVRSVEDSCHDDLE